MAKCIGSVNKWTPTTLNRGDREQVKVDFLVENARQGESAIKARVEAATETLMDLANHYAMIRTSALSDNFKVDCGQVQDALLSKLESLINEIFTTIEAISSSKLVSSTKHRYYIQFTYGFIEKLQQMVQSVGRISDIDQRLFLEEQRNLLISDESITLHSILSIWTALIEIMNMFWTQAKPVFQTSPDESQEYDFIDQLEFSTARVHFAKALLMDLVITSWIKYERLVKYDDLVKGLPFLCQCHTQTFFCTLSMVNEATRDDKSSRNNNLQGFLSDMLHCILDPECRPSMTTININRFGILPLNLCYASHSQTTLAYFVVWHLYSLARYATDDNKEQVEQCRPMLERCFKKAQESFLNVQDTTMKPLSPHQEERFKLLFHMISVWCAKFPTQNAKLLTDTFSFAHSIEDKVEGADYLDNPEFTINGQTLYLFLSKLFNDAIPDFGDDQPAKRTDDETKLIDIWNKILDEHLKKHPEKKQPRRSKRTSG